MGLREKVALILAFITLIQITFVSGSPRDKTPTKNLKHVKQVSRSDPTKQSPVMVSLRPHKKGIKYAKRVPDKNHEAIYRTFNFPDIEYPTATAPRPPFHLQETNILQRNPVQRAADYQTSTNSQYPVKDNRVYNSKYNTKTNSKTVKKPGTTVTIPEFGATPKPYCFKEEGTFPDVEYPLSAKEIWKPNYWKQIPNSGFQNQVNKDGPENNSNIGSNVKSNSGNTPIKAVDHPVSKSDSKKRTPKNTEQVTKSSSTNKSQNKVNTNQYTTKKPRKKNLVVIDVNIPKRTTDKANDQNVTPSPDPSVSTKSTTPFALTPYTTIYFDPTAPPDDKPTTPKDKNKSTKIRSKKKWKKKRPGTKKEDSSTRSKKTTLEDSGAHTTPRTPLSEDKKVKPSESTLNVNVSKSDTCTYVSDNKLTPTSLVTTPTYFYNINQTTVSPLTIYNDGKMRKISSDNSVASITDAINATVPNSTDKVPSCIEDNVRNSNKSSACLDKSNDSPPTSRESDEEFTTDVFPDFDENMSPAFTVSTSTLSPLSSMEEAWAKSEVIDFYKSLAYPDELEEMYIIVK